MTTRARVVYEFDLGRLSLWVLRDEPPGVWRPSDPADGLAGRWDPSTPGVAMLPTVVFPEYDGIADLVMEAFVRHAQTSSGYVLTDARKDYLAERDRVDRLQQAVVTIALGTVSP